MLLFLQSTAAPCASMTRMHFVSQNGPPSFSRWQYCMSVQSGTLERVNQSDEDSCLMPFNDCLCFMLGYIDMNLWSHTARTREIGTQQIGTNLEIRLIVTQKNRNSLAWVLLIFDQSCQCVLPLYRLYVKAWPSIWDDRNSLACLRNDSSYFALTCL